MQIIEADYIYIDGVYRKGFAVAFEEKIVAVAPKEEIYSRYSDATTIQSLANSVLYPGFINTHVHLEFSANSTTLKYGSFLPWLESVIASRNTLLEKCDYSVMLQACHEMLLSGVATVGAISSMGLDLEAYAKSALRVVYFNELVGGNPQNVDTLYDDFMQRYQKSTLYLHNNILPSIAIHSPYALHPIILEKAINFAKEHNIRLTAHFLESQAEREWLEYSEGVFKEFFATLFRQEKATTTIEEFLGQFDGHPTLFTHCVQAKERELKKIAKEGHSIAHCPRSNRYLGCGKLNIDKVQELGIPLSVATDGLSSNNTLNILDELRAALMMHTDKELNSLAKVLLQSITKNAGKILNLPIGIIKEGYQADFALIQLKEAPKQEEDIALWTILHTQRVSKLYIDGKNVIDF